MHLERTGPQSHTLTTVHRQSGYRGEPDVSSALAVSATLSLLGLVRLGSGPNPRGSPRRGNNPGPSEIVCSVKPSLGFTPAYPGLSPSPRPGKKSASRVALEKSSARREPGGDAQRQHDAETIRGGATAGAARRGGDGDGTALSSGRHLLSGEHAAFSPLPSSSKARVRAFFSSPFPIVAAIRRRPPRILLDLVSS